MDNKNVFYNFLFIFTSPELFNTVPMTLAFDRDLHDIA